MLRRIAFGICLVLAAPAAALAAHPVIVPLEDYLAAQKVVHASVNGHQGLFLFDTGEGVSTISPSFAKKIGCEPWGRVTGFRMSGERLDFPRCDNVEFEISGAHVTAPIAGVFDIMALLPKDVPELDGALGLDILAGRVVTIEPHDNRLVIETPQSLATRIRHAKEVPARLVRDAEGVALAIDAGVPTAKGLAWMELDTGNGGTLVIGKHMAPLFGLRTDTEKPQPVRFALTQGIEVSGTARTPDLIMDGNISNQFLKDWNLTLDLAHGRAWLAPARKKST